jgi:hypothetical protein
MIGDKVVLKGSHGRQRKIPLAQLSGEDQVFIELAEPPKFNIDFSKKSKPRFFNSPPWPRGNARRSKPNSPKQHNPSETSVPQRQECARAQPKRLFFKKIQPTPTTTPPFLSFFESTEASGFKNSLCWDRL